MSDGLAPRSSGPRSWRVAEFAHDLGWHDLPADVQRQATRCVLDLCGAALAGSRTGVAGIAATYALEAHGPGRATIIGRRARSTAAGAALANGFAASALDVDDGYRPAMGHPGAVAFPAALAAAEQAQATGPELLTALVVGYELAMRAGLILHPLYGFYHGSGAWAPLGAAAAAARLLGCEVPAIWHALGIAEFHAGLVPEMRSVDHPSMLKDGMGWGALVGLASAQLARHGFTGIPSLFDADQGRPAELVQHLGREYLVRCLYFKPYACCRWAQPAVEGALAAARELGAGAAEIARVRVHTFEAATRLRATTPATTEEAQFSLPWPVASALVGGTVGPEAVLGEGLADPLRRALAARVEMVADPALEAAFPERALAWVEVEASDGRRASSAVVPARGDAEAPLADEQLTDKLGRLAGPVLGEPRVAELARAIEALPAAASLDGLLRLLRSTPPSADRGTASIKGGPA